MTTIEKLNAFVNAKSGLNRLNYPDDYKTLARSIMRDRNDYYELLSLFLISYGDESEKALTSLLTIAKARSLVLVNGIIEFNGQPIQYRRAACSTLAQLIINHLGGQPPNYPGMEEIRATIEQKVSRRVYKNYFN